MTSTSRSRRRELANKKEDAGNMTATEALARTSMLDKIRRKDTGGQELAAISFEELLANMESSGELLDAADLGGGYHLVQGKESKAKFVDVPFIIVDYRINNKWTWGPGVSLMIKTAVPVVFEGHKYDQFILNDGSTGISEQIQSKELAVGHHLGPILVKRGLTRSDYDVVDKETGEPITDPATGKVIQGTTFYLNTAL